MSGELNLDDLRPSLERIGIDPGTSFLNGGATSLFTGSGVTVGRVTNPFEKAIEGMPDQAKLIGDLTNRLVTGVSMYAASYLGEKLAQVMTPPSISDIVNTAQSYLGKYMKPPGQVLKELQSTAEDQVDDILNNSIKESMSSLKEDIASNIGYIKDKISKITADVKNWISYIGEPASKPTDSDTSAESKEDDQSTDKQNTGKQILNGVQTGLSQTSKLINQGPKWVISQVKMIDKQAREEIRKQVGEKTKIIQEKKQEVINGLADSYAKKVADVTNEKVYNATYDKLKNVNILKAKIINIANGLKKQALMMLKAALGQ